MTAKTIQPTVVCTEPVGSYSRVKVPRGEPIVLGEPHCSFRMDEIHHEDTVLIVRSTEAVPRFDEIVKLTD